MECPTQTPGARPQSTSSWHQGPKDITVISGLSRPAVTGGAAALCAHAGEVHNGRLKFALSRLTGKHADQVTTVRENEFVATT